MKSCKHCGMPAQAIKSIRRLRREVDRLTDRNNELQNSKQEEVSARRIIEKEVAKKANAIETVKRIRQALRSPA